MGLGDEVAGVSAWSARRSAVKPSRIIAYIIVFLVIGIFLLATPGAFKIVISLAGLLAALFIFILSTLRLWVCSLALLDPRRQSRKNLSEWQPQYWPLYTVLVPLYKEAHMVASLMESLRKIDYPHDKLDIIFVTESDDLLTCQSVRKALQNGPARFRMFQVAPSQPRTKPKALNAALAATPSQTDGDLITIYDAEDRPHPLQLKAALRAFEDNPDWAAVQAPLGIANNGDNLLTSFFGLEYAALFHVWNPGLARLGLPFTLGGTSNHIRRYILETAGGWDAHNVTEDADLSFRISALGQRGLPVKIGCINMGTKEEAVTKIPAWTHQRTRWLKGFLQTWCVHMRRKPMAPDLDKFHWHSRVRNIIALQITVGSTLLLSYLYVPSLVIITVLIVSNFLGIHEIPFPPLFYFLIVLGYGSAILMNVVGAILAQKNHLIKYAPLTPLYWLLYFHPALIAAWEFITAPSHWRKTEHRRRNASHQGPDTDTHLAAE